MGRLYPIQSAPAPRTKMALPRESADFPSVNSLLEQFWFGVADLAAAAHETGVAIVAGAAPVSIYSRMFRAGPRPPGAFPLNLPEKANTFSGLLETFSHTVDFTAGEFAARFFNVSPSSTMRDAAPSVVVKTSGRVFP